MLDASIVRLRMKDQRVTYFLKTLEELLDSLDATARISRWDGNEAAPEPLRESAGKLRERLGTANGLSRGNFVGSPHVVASLVAITEAIKRLDAAYVQYRSKTESEPALQDDAAMALDVEIGNVKKDLQDRS